jgi:hypothetical protein
MDEIEKADGPARFVCLKVAHQMPARRLAPQFSYLPLCFLNTILAKVCDA